VQDKQEIVPVEIWCKDSMYYPTKATEQSCCWDLHSAQDFKIYKNQTMVVSLGFKLNMPIGWEAQIRSRSGLAKEGLVVANAPGTVDNDYTGNICVILSYNQDGGPAYRKFYRGDRIAQMAIRRVPEVKLIRRDVWDIDKPSRGNNGFGSTGIK